MSDGLFHALRREDQRLVFPFLLPQMCRAKCVYRLHDSDTVRKWLLQARNKIQKLDAGFSAQNFGRVSGNGWPQRADEEVAMFSDPPEDNSFISECILNVSQGESSNSNRSIENDNSYIPGLDDAVALRCLARVPVAQHGLLALLSRRHRDIVRSDLLLRLREEYHIVDHHWICIFTGGMIGTWTAFEPSQNLWRNLAPADVNVLFLSSDKESLAAGAHLLWFGRETFNFVCLRYDMVSSRWQQAPQMVTSRSLFGSATCGRFAFVAGGCRAGGFDTLNSAERYDSIRSIWEPLPPMHSTRFKCAGFFMDRKFYVIGGMRNTVHHQFLTSGEEYDPESREWRTIENMYPLPAGAPTYESPPLVAVAGNQLFAIESSTNVLKSYEKQSNTWTVLGPVPVRTNDSNGWGLAFKGIRDRLYVIGKHENGGVAVYSWRPQASTAAPVWELVNHAWHVPGDFLYNCAVML